MDNGLSKRGRGGRPRGSPIKRSTFRVHRLKAVLPAGSASHALNIGVACTLWLQNDLCAGRPAALLSGKQPGPVHKAP